MTEIEEIKRRLLEDGGIRNINEIPEKLPFSPCYIGPGKWIKLLKDLYAAKNK